MQSLEFSRELTAAFVGYLQCRVLAGTFAANLVQLRDHVLYVRALSVLVGGKLLQSMRFPFKLVGVTASWGKKDQQLERSQLHGKKLARGDCGPNFIPEMQQEGTGVLACLHVLLLGFKT